MVKTQSVKAPVLGSCFLFSSYHFYTKSIQFTSQNQGFFHLCDFLLSPFLVTQAVFALFCVTLLPAVNLGGGCAWLGGAAAWEWRQMLTLPLV